MTGDELRLWGPRMRRVADALADGPLTKTALQQRMVVWPMTTIEAVRRLTDDGYVRIERRRRAQWADADPISAGTCRHHRRPGSVPRPAPRAPRPARCRPRRHRGRKI